MIIRMIGMAGCRRLVIVGAIVFLLPSITMGTVSPLVAKLAVERVRKEPPRLLAGEPVTVTDLQEGAAGVVDLAGGRAERSPGQPIPPTNVLIWRVGDSARVMIRPSGTEPELKIYAEAVRPVGSRDGLAAARARATEHVERLLAAAAAALEPDAGEISQRPSR